ncbi:MAG TPA: Rieske 2Fe-2S domain-containing protein [Acidimicrobiia bacterium]|jgi:cytochrome b6-f complex iron-sulfur subunit|nr:Rieske 2Fe-2S domain-containing protein [Acidimicrobiia bacterium]
MFVAIIVIVIVVIAAASVLLLANRQRAATGNLSRETRKRDHDATAGESTAAGTELELSEEARARADEAAAQAGAPAVRRRGDITVWEPVDEEEIGVTRRQFLNRGILVAMLGALGTFGASLLAFLWPSSSGGFGGTINAGKLSDINAYIATNAQPFYVPEARTYIQPYPKADLPAAKKVYDDYIYASMEKGIVALYQKCVHLGCRVPWCQSAQWFECPCHGSKYNRVGEKRDGPAPRGLDRFQSIISGDNVTVNTGLLSVGPPIGTNTTGQVAEGPHCVG